MQNSPQPPLPPPNGNWGGPSVGSSPSMTPSEERNWAIATHLASFSGYLGIPLGHILGPLLIWLMKKDSSNFLDEVGKETVNYNISIILWFLGAFLMFFTLIGIPLALVMIAVLSVMDIVVTIMAAVAASNGQQYKYPLTIRFIS